MKGFRKQKKGVSLHIPIKATSKHKNADPPAVKHLGGDEVERNDADDTSLTSERDVTPASAWGVMTVLPVELDSRNYDLSNHVASILESQAVSHLERLRCELAARLQQVNQRVDKALHQVGMSRWDINLGENGQGLPPHAEGHFAEQRRRDSMLLKIREHSLDSSERTRIMEELYEWFLLTKDYMVIDVKSEKEAAMEERAVIKIAASIDSAMMNTLTAIGKIKRLGLKLLISAGYIDQLGRRRQPPKIVEEKMLMTEYGKNLDGAIAVVRKCHEELSKIVKSPMLKLWAVSARRQMKNLAVAVVKSYVDHVRLQKSNLEMSKKLSKFTGSSSAQEERISNMNHQLKLTKKTVDEQKEELRSLEKLLAAAHQRGDYLEEQYNKLASERTFEAQFSGKSILATEVKMVKTALTNTPSVSALNSSAQTDDSGNTQMPEGLIMIEKTTLNKLNNELKRLKRKLKEATESRSDESNINELGVTVSNETRSQATLPLIEKDWKVVTRLKEELSRSHDREEDLLQQCRDCEKEVEDLREQLTELSNGGKLKELQMNNLQRLILRGFRNFLPSSWSLRSTYEDTKENVESMLRYLMDSMTSLYYDNKRMASYVRDQLDYNFPGAIQRWIDKAKKTLNTEALEERRELSILADTYEAKSRIRPGESRPRRSEREQDLSQMTHSRPADMLSASDLLSLGGQDMTSQEPVHDKKKKVTVHKSLMSYKSATPLADEAKSMPLFHTEERKQELSAPQEVSEFRSAEEQNVAGKPSTVVSVSHSKQSRLLKSRSAKEMGNVASAGGQVKVKGAHRSISRVQSKRSKPANSLDASKENLSQPPSSVKELNQYHTQPKKLKPVSSLTASRENLPRPPSFVKDTTEQASTFVVTSPRDIRPGELTALPAIRQEISLSEGTAEVRVIAGGADDEFIAEVERSKEAQLGAELHEMQDVTDKKKVKVNPTRPEQPLRTEIQQDNKTDSELSPPTRLKLATPGEQKMAVSADTMVGEPAVGTKGTEIKIKSSKRENSAEPSTATRAVRGSKMASDKTTTRASNSSGGKKRDLSKLFRVGITAVYGQVRKPTPPARPSRSATPSPSHHTSVILGNASDVPKSALKMIRGQGLLTIEETGNMAQMATAADATSAATTAANVTPAATTAADVISAATTAALAAPVSIPAAYVTAAMTTAADIAPSDITDTETVIYSNETAATTSAVRVAIATSAIDVSSIDTTLTPAVSTSSRLSAGNKQMQLGALRSKRNQSSWNKPSRQMSDVSSRCSLGSITSAPGASGTDGNLSDQHLVSAEKAKFPHDRNVKLAEIDDIWEDLNVDILPPANRELAEVLASRWNGIKEKIAAYVHEIEIRALRSSNGSKNATNALNEETAELKLQLDRKEDMLRSLQAEKLELSARLKKVEQKMRHVNQSMATQTHQQVRKYSYIMEDLDAIKLTYESSQSELKLMKSEVRQLVTRKEELLDTIRQQRLQYDRISNLHRHLIAKLETYMLQNSMLAEDIKPSQEMQTKEKHKARVDRLKYLCRCPDVKAELRSMVEVLMTNLRGVGEGEDKMEMFVEQYLELPGTTTIEQLKKTQEFCKSDGGKTMNVIGALSAFDKKLNEQISTVSSKLNCTRQTLMDGRNLYSEGCDTRRQMKGSPEPGAPDGGKRSDGTEKNLIQKELLVEAKSLMSFPARTLPTSQMNRDLRREGTNKTWPEVTGTVCQPSKPSSLWSREKSILNEKATFSKHNQDLLDQLHTRWLEMDFKTSTKLNDMKGPKHQARLKAVRGYCVDEKTVSLLPHCSKKDSPGSLPTQRENTIKYRALSFLD